MRFCAILGMMETQLRCHDDNDVNKTNNNRNHKLNNTRVEIFPSFIVSVSDMNFFNLISVHTVSNTRVTFKSMFHTITIFTLPLPQGAAS